MQRVGKKAFITVKRPWPGRELDVVESMQFRSAFVRRTYQQPDTDVEMDDVHPAGKNRISTSELLCGAELLHTGKR